MDASLSITFFVTAFILALIAMPIIINLAIKKQIFEINDERKTHIERVSSLGGIGILMAFMLPVLIVMQPGLNSPIAVFALVLPLFAVSLVDDAIGVGVTLRFVVQALIGLGLSEMGFQIVIVEGYWLLNLSATIFFTMLMINAFNLIDGINGLAGGFGLIGSLVLGVVLARFGETDLAMASFAYAGALLGFLGFNFGKQARIFMGDNGSTVLGFFMTVMILALLKHHNVANGSAAIWPMIFAVTVIPVVDVFKVFSFRLMRLQSPFSADRTHIHHLFTDGLVTHPMACAIMHGWTLLLVGLAFFAPEILSFPVLLVSAFGPYLLAKSMRVVGGHIAGGTPVENTTIAQSQNTE